MTYASDLIEVDQGMDATVTASIPPVRFDSAHAVGLSV